MKPEGLGRGPSVLTDPGSSRCHTALRSVSSPGPGAAAWRSVPPAEERARGVPSLSRPERLRQALQIAKCQTLTVSREMSTDNPNLSSNPAFKQTKRNKTIPHCPGRERIPVCPAPRRSALQCILGVVVFAGVLFSVSFGGFSASLTLADLILSLRFEPLIR